MRGLISRIQKPSIKKAWHDEKALLVTKRAVETEKKKRRCVRLSRGKPQPTMSTASSDWLEINLEAPFSCY